MQAKQRPGFRPRKAKPARIYVLDGRRFSSLEEFYDELSRVLIPDTDWGRNLDGFNDVLRGGYGIPAGGFTIRWTHSARSRQVLAYAETERQLRLRAAKCTPDDRGRVEQQIRDAERQSGPTVFDWLVEIFRAHGPGGEEAGDRVVLVLD